MHHNNEDEFVEGDNSRDELTIKSEDRDIEDEHDDEEDEDENGHDEAGDSYSEN